MRANILKTSKRTYFDNVVFSKFIIKLIFMFVMWKGAFFFVWRSPSLLQAYNEMSLVVIDYILMFCGALMDFVGYAIEIDSPNRILKLQGTVGVTVGEPCIGYEITALYIALIVATAGSLKHKLWYIPMGVAIIFMLNVIRICALALLVRIDPRIWELNHKLIFTVVVYSCTFLLWRLWIKSDFGSKDTEQE